MDETTIPNSYKTAFRDNLTLGLQQLVSRFRPCVDEADYSGEGAMAVETLGATDVQDANDRYGDTPLMIPTVDSRWVYPQDVEWGTLIAKKDKLREVTDPTSKLMKNAAAAFGRRIDMQIKDAFFGVAKTGLKGAVNKAFPNSQIINVQLGGGGADAGITYDKVNKAKEMLLAAEVDLDNDELYWGISAKQNSDIMSLIEAKSSQYNEKPVIEKGIVKSWMGFNFVHSEKLDKVGNNRLTPVWAKSGMHLGRWNELETSLERDPGKKYQPRPYAFQSFGATRTDELKVVQVPCKEA